MRFWYWLVFGVIVWVIYSQLPFHQDEFLHFHSLAYQNPNFSLNQFKEGFAAYEKFFPGDFSVYFPFLYTGNLQGILWSPFYAMLPILEAKVAYSVISLLVIIGLILRVFRLSTIGHWFLFLYIPLYVAVLRDAGPVNVALIVFMASLILLEKIAIPSRFTWVYVCLLALLWCLAFYDKLFFVYLMPGILVFSFARLPVHTWMNPGFLGKMGVAIGLFALFVLAYVFADIRVRQYQSAELFDVQIPFYKAITTSDAMIWLEDRRLVCVTLLAQFDFSFYVLRHLEYTDFVQSKVWGGLHWFGISFMLLLLLESRHADRKAKWYLGSFFALVITFLVLGKIRFGHHTIFLFLPLIGFWFDGRTPTYGKALLVWVLCNVSLTGLNVLGAKPHVSLQTDYRALVGKTKLVQPVIVNFDSWNYYYLRNLDSDQAIVTWVDLRDSVQTNRLFALAKKMRRPIVNVSGSQDVWNQNWLLIQNRVDSVSVDQTFPANPISTLRIKQ
jgi:hypothetical protein